MFSITSLMWCAFVCALVSLVNAIFPNKSFPCTLYVKEINLLIGWPNACGALLHHDKLHIYIYIYRFHEACIPFKWGQFVRMFNCFPFLNLYIMLILKIQFPVMLLIAYNRSLSKKKNSIPQKCFQLSLFIARILGVKRLGNVTTD